MGRTQHSRTFDAQVLILGMFRETDLLCIILCNVNTCIKLALQ